MKTSNFKYTVFQFVSNTFKCEQYIFLKLKTGLNSIIKGYGIWKVFFLDNIISHIFYGLLAIMFPFMKLMGFIETYLAPDKSYKMLNDRPLSFYGYIKVCFQWD